MDTDWCSEAVLRHALQLMQGRDLPCTIFATGGYQALRDLPASFEIGLHPNFNDVTAIHYAERIAALHRLYPQAIGISSHAMTASTTLLELFKQHGMRYDRNLLLYRQHALLPFRHYNGLLRVPIFWEDDIWFSLEPGTRFHRDWLEPRGGVCVFNFHPIHLFMNTESRSHYESFKAEQHDAHFSQSPRGSGYGTLSFFEELCVYLSDHQIATSLLRDLVKP